MTKNFDIEVDCANCAAKMEQAAGKIKGVIGINVNFMTLKMTVEFAEGADTRKVMKEILRVCRRIEPDCEIYF